MSRLPITVLVVIHMAMPHGSPLFNLVVIKPLLIARLKVFCPGSGMIVRETKTLLHYIDQLL